MDIYLIWSKEQSRRVAEALRTWLPCVVDTARPWMSTEVEKGAGWFQAIYGRLCSSVAGITCVTPENRENPWLLFETGALVARINRPAVRPYLLSLNPGDIAPPLSELQLTLSNREDTLRLVDGLVHQLPEENRPTSEVVKSRFDKFWPDLDASLREIEKAGPRQVAQRKDREILEEILSYVRHQTLHDAIRQGVAESQVAAVRGVSRDMTLNASALYDAVLNVRSDRNDSDVEPALRVVLKDQMRK